MTRILNGFGGANSREETNGIDTCWGAVIKTKGASREKESKDEIISKFRTVCYRRE